jgi:hydrogenase nickel insertion protein HypA
MHELSLMRDLMEIIESEALKGKISRIVLEIGVLAAVDPGALRQSFDVCVEGTSLADAELQIVRIPARYSCPSCGTQTGKTTSEASYEASLGLECCGASMNLTTGKELRLRHIELLGEDTVRCA